MGVAGVLPVRHRSPALFLILATDSHSMRARTLRNIHIKRWQNVFAYFGSLPFLPSTKKAMRYRRSVPERSWHTQNHILPERQRTTIRTITSETAMACGMACGSMAAAIKYGVRQPCCRHLCHAAAVLTCQRTHSKNPVPARRCAAGREDRAGLCPAYSPFQTASACTHCFQDNTSYTVAVSVSLFACGSVEKRFLSPHIFAFGENVRRKI